MRGWITRPVKFNAIICGLIAGGFGLPLGQIPVFLLGGLIFGILMGVGLEVLVKRYEGRWLYKRRLLILASIESLLLLYLFLPMYMGYFSVHPFVKVIPKLPDDLAVESVTLNTRDGIRLRGCYLPSENGAAIIAVHGSGGNRESMLPYMRLLNEHGYGVLSFDMRAHGESDGTFGGGWNAELDIEVAVDYLKTRPEVEPNRIGAIGLSSGAIMILYGGAPSADIQAFVADGVGVGTVGDLLDPLIPHPLVAPLLIPDYWTAEFFISLFSGVEKGPALHEAVQDIAPRPILFIAGEDSNWELELAQKYASNAGDSSEIWLVPDTGHIGAIVTHPEEYETRVIQFFDEVLLD